MCVTYPSTLRGAAAKPPPTTTNRHSVRRDGALHRCGWQPPRLTIDDVAKRVWPWKTSGAPPSDARRVAAPSQRGKGYVKFCHEARISLELLTCGFRAADLDSNIDHYTL